MPAGDLRALLGARPDSELMRTLILAEVAALRQGVERPALEALLRRYLAYRWPAAGKRKTAELLYGPYTRRTLGGAKQWTLRGSKTMQKRRLSYSHAAGRFRVGGY